MLDVSMVFCVVAICCHGMSVLFQVKSNDFVNNVYWWLI